MRILAFSDIHGLLPEFALDGIDRIAIAGDICPVANHSPKFQRRWLEQIFCPWVERLKLPVYLALGNHDFVDDFPAPSNLHYGTERVVDDMFLFSWTPPFFDWAWMAEENEIARRLDAALGEDAPCIWVVHGPPRDVCDEARGRHCGSTALYKAIVRRQPLLVICGHLHEGSPEGWIGDSNIRNVAMLPDGKTLIDYRRGNTRVLNVSLIDESYRQFKQPVVIEMDEFYTTDNQLT